ncbi:hypothetical protein [Endozoicomonas sp. 8E]|uniref:hypothetical protein n=1 Tax=Endozoicomonas sp. 8E TaxID=3035692 RepID=UPI0029392E7B|nr:hypothetical protein [Endozoicomonas sp. 8E]WOG25518.1 hypothetical protein P6910_13090 [Endozoicomonas sp. 8E]
MKMNVRSIIFYLLLLLSSYSYSKDLHLNWKLEHQNNLLLSGKAETTNQVSHSNSLTGWNDHPSELDISTLPSASCSGNDFAIYYDVVSFTTVNFDQNNPDYTVPKLFRTLLGNGNDHLNHSFNTQYTLRGHTTKASNIAELFCCVLCHPFHLAFKKCSTKVSHGSDNELARIRALEAAIAGDFPEHVTIHKCALYHGAVDSHHKMLSSSSTEAKDAETHIFDLFLNTPETQHWLIENLNTTTNQSLELIIPELCYTAVPAVIFVQENNGESHDEILQPSHFLSLDFTNGVKVQYHLNRVSDINIEILAIVVSVEGYTLTLVVDNYDVSANQPPPHYAALPKTCHCNGACNCDHSRENDTDNSDVRIHRINIMNHRIFFPHTH